MKMQNVKSSMIHSIGYDPDKKILAVKFNGGPPYHYEGVDQKAYDALMGAESIGKHFGTHIRDNYKLAKK